jgi:putative endopeptidase
MSFILPDDLHLSENETFAISSREYLDELEKIIVKTSERTIVNFIIWRIIDSYSGLLGNVRGYVNDTRTRSSKCFDFVLYQLPISVNANWVRKYFKLQIKAAASKIITSIKEEFKKLFEKNTWLDETTKQNAIYKLNKMTAVIGYPDELLDDQKLYQRYENLTVDESKFFESILEINKFHRYGSFKILHDARNRTDWIVNSFVTTVNAFYFATENNIRIPAAFLQGDFFNTTWTKSSGMEYLNYASLGFTLGKVLLFLIISFT